MSWKLEIYRAIFVAFGAFETIMNVSFLLKKDGLTFAAKQHGEIPKWANKNQLRIKVIFMLLFGVLFLGVGLYSYILHSIKQNSFITVLTIFSMYAVGEGIYYRYWKTFGFSIVSILLLVCFII